MYSLFLYFYLGANGGIKCKTKLIGRFWTVWTSLCNLGITLSSELQLRWFKMLWNAKKKIYNFHVLSFERYWLHQGRNRAWSYCSYLMLNGWKIKQNGIMVNLKKSGVRRNISNIGLILCRTENSATLILELSPTGARMERYRRIKNFQ